MKSFFLFFKKNFCFISVGFIFVGFAKNEQPINQDFQGIPTALLTFSERIPAELTLENQEAIAKERLNQEARNQSIQRSKTLPWQKIFLSLVAFFFFLLLRYFPRTKESSLKKEATPEDKARKSIQTLKDKNVEVAEFYEELSTILRFYIEERYKIKAPKETTEEFLASLKEDFPLKNEQTLSQFLKLADLVKFAKENPTEADCKRALSLINQLIEREM